MNGKPIPAGPAAAGKRWRVASNNILLALLLVLALALLPGCRRHGFHDREEMQDPAKVEERLAEKEVELAEELKIRTDAQKAAFDDLASYSKGVIRRWIANRQKMHDEVGRALKDPANEAGILENAFRDMVKNKTSDEEWNTIIDKAAALYKTLDEDQKEHLRKQLSRWHNWN
ncbi:MAG: hypothetical protein OEZ59_06530 [Deltaproteobacteria bacterium]|nr:hypothetical protein [Deltaproteobacteria bacterium]